MSLENLNANVYTEKYRALPDDENAKGLGRVDQGLKRLSKENEHAAAVYGASSIGNLRMAAQEKSRASANLAQGFGAMNKEMGHLAKSEVNRDIQYHREQIRAVEASEMEPRAKMKALDELNMKAVGFADSLYGQVYNNAINANYIQESHVRTQEFQDLARKLAKDEPELFKDHYKQLTDNYLKTAPTPEAYIGAELAMEKTGLAGYRHLYDKKQKEFLQESARTSKLSLEKIEETNRFLILKGDAVSRADMFVNNIEKMKILDHQIALGNITKAEKEQYVYASTQKSIEYGINADYEKAENKPQFIKNLIKHAQKDVTPSVSFRKLLKIDANNKAHEAKGILGDVLTQIQAEEYLKLGSDTGALNPEAVKRLDSYLQEERDKGTITQTEHKKLLKGMVEDLGTEETYKYV